MHSQNDVENFKSPVTAHMKSASKGQISLKYELYGRSSIRDNDPNHLNNWIVYHDRLLAQV
jgi:hypothetical protein